MLIVLTTGTGLSFTVHISLKLKILVNFFWAYLSDYSTTICKVYKSLAPPFNSSENQ